MIKTRKPTGVVPWPLILVEGGEKVGKTYAAAELSASSKVGQTYWIDLAEGAGDEYGVIPGARYEIVVHDGTWRDILGQVEEIRDEAARAQEAGEPPVVLVIDSATAEWMMLSDWAASRAKKSNSNRAKLAKDPDSEITISMNYWNDATNRHRKLMTILLTFPGIVVITARGKEIAAIGDDGRPSGDKTYKVEGHKNLAFDATVHVRLSRDAPPLIVGARSVHSGIRPGVDRPKPMPNFTLEKVIFDVLRCNPATAHVRDVKVLDASAPTDEEMGNQALKAAKDEVWHWAKKVGMVSVEDLVVDYAKTLNGALLAEATVSDLQAYAKILKASAESETT